MKILIRRLATTLLAGTLAGCGGGGTDSTVAPVSAATLAVTARLNLDLSAPGNYSVVAWPTHYDAAVLASDNTPAADPIADRIAVLGRVLFHDRNLSLNNTIACASCHQQALGFDDGHRFSVGFSGLAFTAAHAMRLGNGRFFRPGTAFWDRRAASIELQATQPIQHPVEMGFDADHGGLPALFAKLQALPYYPELFSFAFGDGSITEPRLQRALAQFQRSMVSINSRWDSGYASVYNPALPDRGLALPLAGFTVAEERGRALFMAPPQQGGLGCAGCHVPPSFALAANARSNGLDPGETTVFKAPSLKNVGLSRAFMHDGRFATLAQVVEHYNSGVQSGPALDNRLFGPGGAPRPLNLSAPDKDAVVAFLHTLTDTVLTTDPKFSNPFKP